MAILTELVIASSSVFSYWKYKNAKKYNIQIFAEGKYDDSLFKNYLQNKKSDSIYMEPPRVNEVPVINLINSLNLNKALGHDSHLISYV